MNKKRMFGALVLSFGAMLLAIASPANETYETYYSYLGNYPSEAKPGWHQNVQGLTHDRDNWFITQTTDLWKIPVTCDLKSVTGNDGLLLPGINHKRLGEYSRLVNAGYNHFGAPGYYKFDGQGYVIVPIEGADRRISCAAVAAFKADTLEFQALQCLPEQVDASWAAIDLKGNLYSSDSDGATKVNKYSVDWWGLKNTWELNLTKVDSVSLLDEQDAPVTLRGAVQGGVISPSGQLLYLVAGYLDNRYPNDGINVFDLSTGERVRRSSSRPNGYGDFNYEFHVGFPDYEEPEGLTIWDLDADGRAPCSGGDPCIDGRLHGQLHVLMLRNGVDDHVYLKHYTGTIYVDRAYTGKEEKGTPGEPFKTVGRANIKAWGGAQIKIRTGQYPEKLTFSKPIRVVAEGGAATVGR
jgi:hypothetical protein